MNSKARQFVVVGYDGSPASETAAFWAATEAERRHAALRLVHVLALPMVSSPMGIRLPRPRRLPRSVTRLDQQVAGALRALPGRGRALTVRRPAGQGPSPLLDRDRPAQCGSEIEEEKR